MLHVMIMFLHELYYEGVDFQSGLLNSVALVIAFVGFAISVVVWGLGWFIPNVHSQPPLQQVRYRTVARRHHRKRHGSNADTSPHTTTILVSSTLRRSASFPSMHSSPSSSATNSVEPRPTPARHVSFNMSPPHVPRLSLPDCIKNPTTPTGLSVIQRKLSNSVTPFAKRAVGIKQSPRSSISSGDSTGTFVASPSSAGSAPAVHDSPLKCFDKHCACQTHPRGDCTNELGMTMDSVVEEQTLASSPSSSSSAPARATFQRDSLSIRLPKMRAAFSSKRRHASIDMPPTYSMHRELSEQAANPFAVQDPSHSPTRSRAMSHPQAGPGTSVAPIAVTEGSKLTFKNTERSNSTARTSGEMYRETYVSPFKLKRVKTTPTSSPLRRETGLEREPSIPFSNPWPEAGPSTSVTTSATVMKSVSKADGSRRSFIKRFTSLRTRKFTPPLSPLAETSQDGFSSSRHASVPLVVSKSKGKGGRAPATRTQPYGPPYNAPMPGQERTNADGSVRGGSDPEVYVRRPFSLKGKVTASDASKDGRTSRRKSKSPSKKKTVPKGGSVGNYPPPNLMSELDERLIALQETRKIDEKVERARQQRAADSYDREMEEVADGGLLSIMGLRDMARRKGFGDGWSLGVAI